MSVLEKMEKKYNTNGLRMIYMDGKCMDRSVKPYTAGEVSGLKLVMMINEAKDLQQGLAIAISEMTQLLENIPYGTDPAEDINVKDWVVRTDMPDFRPQKVVEINRELRRLYLEIGNGSCRWVQADEYQKYTGADPHLYYRDND